MRGPAHLTPLGGYKAQSLSCPKKTEKGQSLLPYDLIGFKKVFSSISTKNDVFLKIE